MPTVITQYPKLSEYCNCINIDEAHTDLSIGNLSWYAINSSCQWQLIHEQPMKQLWWDYIHSVTISGKPSSNNSSVSDILTYIKKKYINLSSTKNIKYT